jgi:transcriptional regulator with XRE-family HTH domain
MANTSEIGRLLRAARERRGQSLRNAATGLGVDPSYLSRVEVGMKPPSSAFSQNASQYYGLSPDELALASGTVPDDILEILRDNPALLAELRLRHDGS